MIHQGSQLKHVLVNNCNITRNTFKYTLLRASLFNNNKTKSTMTNVTNCQLFLTICNVRQKSLDN